MRAFADFVFENIFRFYTEKQWGRKIEQLDPSIMQRVPVYVSREDRYFTDTFQLQPKGGFTALFERMLDHPNIRIVTGTDALTRLRVGEDGVFFDGAPCTDEVIFTGQADELLGYRFGKRPTARCASSSKRSPRPSNPRRS